MANLIPLAIADFETQLSTSVSVGSTTFSITSATDDDGVSLPAGKYCFTVDNGSSNKEYFIGQLNGSDITSVKSVSRQGVETTGAVRAHRIGSTCIISDFATIQRVADILRGVLALDGSSPIEYDAEPTLSDRKELATVGYVLDTASGGTVAFDSLIVQGNGGEAIVAGNLVYFKTSDQEWYKTDADTVATIEGVQLGIAKGTGSDGVAITGGIQTAGTYTTTGLTAGSLYYASNTAGAISSSAGTTARVIGIALSTTKLLIIQRDPQAIKDNQKDALAGYSTPTGSNPFLTQNDASSLVLFPTPQVVTFTSSGTWTKDAGLKYIIVEGVGAGATSSGTASGGGGGYFRKLILASALGATETVTIGTTGSPGGNTTFGAHCTGNGGTRSAGGTATGGDINIPGGHGTNSGSGGTGGNYGMGGDSVLGFAAIDGINAVGYGAGSAGANGSSSNTSGTNGYIGVTEYYS